MHALTKAQSESLEAAQKHAIHIIYNSTRGMLRLSMLFYANLNLLDSRRENLSRVFFCNIMDPASCLTQFPTSTQIHSNYLKARIFPNISKSLYPYKAPFLITVIASNSHLCIHFALFKLWCWLYG